MSPKHIGYLSGGTQNINTAIEALQTKNTNISFATSTTTVSNTLAASTLNVATQLNLTGNLFVNATSISPTVLSYLSGLSSNCQSQINALPTTTTVSALSGQINALQIQTTNMGYATGTTTFSDNISITGNLTLPSSTSIIDISALTSGGIKVDSITTLTPLILTYLSGLTSNAQTQLNTVSTATGTNTTSISTINTNLTTINTNITAIIYASSTTSIVNKIYFNGNNATALPTTTSTNAGLGIFWNANTGAKGESGYLNYASN